MPIFMGTGAALAFAVAGYALLNTKSDIQIGITVTAFFAGLILWGLAALFQKMKDERR